MAPVDFGSSAGNLLEVKAIEVESRTHTWVRLMAYTTGQRRPQECAVGAGKDFSKKGTVPFGYIKGAGPLKLAKK